MCPTGPKNPNYYIWKKLYNTLEDLITASSASVCGANAGSFSVRAHASAAGDTLLSTPSDKFRKRFGCLIPEVEGDPEKPAGITEMSETLSMLVIQPFIWRIKACHLGMAEHPGAIQTSPNEFPLLKSLARLDSLDAGSHLTQSSNTEICRHSHSLS